MRHLFIPYKQALQLKELGFNEECFATYRKHACSGNPFEYNLDFHTKVQLDHNLCPKNSEYVNDWISAPTYQQAFDWARKNGLAAVVQESMRYDKNVMYYLLSELKTDKRKPEKFYKHKASKMYTNYDEAQQACLEKVIETIKTYNYE